MVQQKYQTLSTPHSATLYHRMTLTTTPKPIKSSASSLASPPRTHRHYHPAPHQHYATTLPPPHHAITTANHDYITITPHHHTTTTPHYTTTYYLSVCVVVFVIGVLHRRVRVRARACVWLNCVGVCACVCISDGDCGRQLRSVKSSQ